MHIMLMLLQPGRVNSEGNQRSHRPITRRRVQARCRSPGRGRRRFCWQTSSSRCQCKNNAGRTGSRAKSQNRRVAFHRQRMHVWSEASQAYTVAWRRPQYSPCTRGTAPCSRAGLLLPSRMLSSSCMFTRLSVCARIMQRTERNAASRACKVAEPGEGAVKPRGPGPGSRWGRKEDTCIRDSWLSSRPTRDRSSSSICARHLTRITSFYFLVLHRFAFVLVSAIHG